MAAVLGIALVASATFAPNLPSRIHGLSNGGNYSDVELIFNQSDIREINNRVREKKEFGWCLSTEKLEEDRFSVDLGEGENMIERHLRSRISVFTA